MSASIVTIADCTALQIVGNESFKIATGTLSLEKFDDDSTHAPLLLKIAESSFALPIEKDAIVGTRGDRSYLFSKKLTSSTLAKKATNTSETDSPEATEDDGELAEVSLETEDERKSKSEAVLLVQIDMPATASEADLTVFEKCLVDHKFLMVGAQADADNLSRAFLEWTGIKTTDLRSYTSDNTSGPATSQPTQFSDTTHAVAGNVASGSSTVAEAALKVGQTIDAAMISIGSFIGSKIGTKGAFTGETEAGWKRDTQEAVKDGAESLQIGGSAVVQGIKHAAGEVSESGSKMVEHHYGTEARTVKEHVGTTLQNTGSVGATALQQSSAIGHGVQLGQGAVAEE